MVFGATILAPVPGTIVWTSQQILPVLTDAGQRLSEAPQVSLSSETYNRWPHTNEDASLGDANLDKSHGRGSE